MIDLLSLDESGLAQLAHDCGDARPYRLRQIWQWIYRRGVDRIDEMTDLATPFRAELARRATIDRLRVLRRQVSEDGTQKLLLRLRDGLSIETVVLRHPGRHTGCLSTQVGCAMGCSFCATALGGLKRNLSAGEIVDQVSAVRRETGVKLTNLVFMGMGEPLANYDNLALAARILTSPHGLSFGPRQLTVSTAGLVPAIDRLATDALPFNLALSLHATTDEMRSKLMPINRAWPLGVLLAACDRYVRTRKRFLTLEFLLLGGINDGLDEAKRLAAIARRLESKVNLIPWNPVAGLVFHRPAEVAVRAFQKAVEDGGAFVRRRETRGVDIAAACGQLLRTVESVPMTNYVAAAGR